MGLEQRGSGVYYYKKSRVGRRVVSEYVASGQIARDMALIEKLCRIKEDRIRTDREIAFEKVLHRIREVSRTVSLAYSRAEVITTAAMLLTGHHRPKRGTWRKESVTAKTTAKRQPKPKAAPPAPRDPSLPFTQAERTAIEDRARDGDKTVMPELKLLLKQRPDLIDHYGNVALYADEELVRNWVGDKDLLLLHTITRRLHAMADELAGPDPSPLERLLARRAAFCWTAVNIAEHILAAAKNVTMNQRLALQKHVDHTHRRFVSAAKALALVRRLEVPQLLAVVQQTAVINNNAAAAGPDGALALQ